MSAGRRAPRACMVLWTGAREERRRKERRLAQWSAWLERSSSGATATRADARRCAVAVRPARRLEDAP